MIAGVVVEPPGPAAGISIGRQGLFEERGTPQPGSCSFRYVSAAVFCGILGLLLLPATGIAQSAAPDPALVNRALAHELKAAQDTTHPMRYRLRKSTPRLTTVKEIVETRDGAVARLISVNDQPLTLEDRQKDQARLDALMADPGKQHKRKQSEQDDTARALKVLKALPKAFIYEYAGGSSTGLRHETTYTFRPNPKFDPPDLETQVLTALTGQISIDTDHERVVRLEGHLQQDVDFGWGILGRLNKGGSLVIEQANIGEDQWRIVHFRMVMSGRVLIRTRSFDTTEDESQFAPVPIGMGYQEGVKILRSREEEIPGAER